MIAHGGALELRGTVRDWRVAVSLEGRHAPSMVGVGAQRQRPSEEEPAVVLKLRVAASPICSEARAAAAQADALARPSKNATPGQEV